jgi:hypothetical protein
LLSNELYLRGRGVGAAVATFTSSIDEVDKFLERELSNDDIRSGSDLLDDLRAESSVVEILSEVVLDGGAPVGPVDGFSSDGVSGPEVGSQTVEGESVDLEDSDGDFVSDEVDEEGGASLEGDVGGLHGGGPGASEVAGGQSHLSEGSSVDPALSLVGGHAEVDGGEGEVEVGGESERVDVDDVLEGGETDDGQGAVGSAHEDLKDWVQGDVEGAFGNIQGVLNCCTEPLIISVIVS